MSGIDAPGRLWAGRLGPYGVFRRASWVDAAFAAEIEALGYRTLWLAGSPAGDLRQPEELLDATTGLVLATGVINIWQADAAIVAAAYHRIESSHPGRLLLGLGVGHPESTGERYRRPYAAVEAYLDELDAFGVPASARVLAALGPRMLALSAARAVGAHPYLVTPEHTRRARALLGQDALLAPEQKLVAERDLDEARRIGRPAIRTPYLELDNYVRSLRSLGFGDEDVADPGSDHLVDALVVSGDRGAQVAGLAQHLAAGADHVAVNVVTEAGGAALSVYAGLAARLAAARVAS
ncbi:TIGR03620 family F420-dependent LLM class oxidoreductase [Jatrophihabitans sp.]|uniref:TIGR03620 family F420-dependent LLM class oxidoreductase n=1 Tax=Jatrophihabitans sp. TaxID=1932789 RepID=UPI0030C6E1EB|nr:class F420-dependent oxidoreductase [Jatrophihabitans sp.]